MKSLNTYIDESILDNDTQIQKRLGGEAALHKLLDASYDHYSFSHSDRNSTLPSVEADSEITFNRQTETIDVTTLRIYDTTIFKNYKKEIGYKIRFVGAKPELQVWNGNSSNYSSKEHLDTINWKDVFDNKTTVNILELDNCMFSAKTLEALPAANYIRLGNKATPDNLDFLKTKTNIKIYRTNLQNWLQKWYNNKYIRVE